MTHQQFVTKMQELNKRLAEAKGVEELKKLKEEVMAVLAAPRT